MKKTNIVLTLGGICLAGSAFAAEVGGVKKAPFENLLGNAYGSAEVSHHLKRMSDKDASHVRLDATYTLGTKLFEEKLDIYATVGVKKNTEKSYVSQKSTEIQADYYAYTNDYLTFMPYVLVTTPYVDSKDVSHSTEGRAGFELEPKYDMSTNAGVVGLAAGYDATATFSSRPKDIAVYNDKGDILEIKEESRALGLRQIASVKGYYTPNFADGLYLEYKLAHRADGTPKLVKEEDGKIVQKHGRTGLNEYKHVGGTSHRVRVKYNLTDDLYVQNDFTYFNKKKSDDRAHYENVVAVNAVLF